MKKYISLLAIAPAITASSFTMSGSNNSDKFTPSYYWYNATLVYHDFKTEADEILITGCSTGTNLCVNGYNASQLINPGNPNLGVKPGQIPASTLRHF